MRQKKYAEEIYVALHLWQLQIGSVINQILFSIKIFFFQQVVTVLHCTLQRYNGTLSQNNCDYDFFCNQAALITDLMFVWWFIALFTFSYCTQCYICFLVWYTEETIQEQSSHRNDHQSNPDPDTTVKSENSNEPGDKQEGMLAHHILMFRKFTVVTFSFSLACNKIHMQRRYVWH